MFRVLFIFIFLFVSVCLGIQLSHDPGYLLIAINHWTIETTLWFAILLTLIAFLLLHTVLIICGKITHSPARYQAWRVKYRAQRAQAKTRRGLIEFSEGHWQEAKNHLIKALPDSDAPLLNYLTAARAAQEMGDNQLRDNYLREAQQSMPDAKIAVELTQAQLQLANKQWEQALATLKHLQVLAPRHPYVLKLLMQLYQEIKDWPQLIALLPELQKYRVLSATDFEKLRHQAYLQAICEYAKNSQIQLLTQLVANLPKPLKYDADLMAEYARFLMANNQLELAQSILRKSLDKQFSDKLITLFGQISINENQLTYAESWLKKQPHSADLYLCLGRLSFANHLWGKARNYFEKSIELKPTPQAFEELGKMMEVLNEQAKACRAYQQGLALATQK